MAAFLQSYGALLLVICLLLLLVWMSYDKRGLEKEHEENSQAVVPVIGCGNCQACPRCRVTRK